MSKMLNGPPGSPLGLCSGTSMTSINPIGPFCDVPQTGQPEGLLPQLFRRNSTPNRATRFRSGTILVFIQSPPTISGACQIALFQSNCSTGPQRYRIHRCRFPYQPVPEIIETPSRPDKH